MKKTIIAFLVSFSFCSFANADFESEGFKTETIHFSSEDGSFLKKVYYKLEKVAGMEFEVLVTTDLNTSQKSACLRLKKSSYPNTFIGTMNTNEIDAALQSLVYIRDNLSNLKPEQYTEYVYRTIDGVKFCAFYDDFYRKWKGSIQTKPDELDSKSEVKFSDFQKIIDNLNEAKIIINNNTIIIN